MAQSKTEFDLRVARLFKASQRLLGSDLTDRNKRAFAEDLFEVCKSILNHDFVGGGDISMKSLPANSEAIVSPGDEL
jgi:hypothetical protein